jgi:hypothetical protein
MIFSLHLKFRTSSSSSLSSSSSSSPFLTLSLSSCYKRMKFPFLQSSGGEETSFSLNKFSFMRRSKMGRGLSRASDKSCSNIDTSVSECPRGHYHPDIALCHKVLSPYQDELMDYLCLSSRGRYCTCWHDHTDQWGNHLAAQCRHFQKYVSICLVFGRYRNILGL